MQFRLFCGYVLQDTVKAHLEKCTLKLVVQRTSRPENCCHTLLLVLNVMGAVGNDSFECHDVHINGSYIMMHSRRIPQGNLVDGPKHDMKSESTWNTFM